MRTDTAKTLDVNNAGHSSSDCKETMKVVRKSLHPLQVAAGDKENLVGAGRMLSTVSEKDGKVLAVKSNHTKPSPKKDKQKLSKHTEKKTITEKDLTSEEGPSEKYWELMAETRRKALEKTLKENQQLHELVNQLIEERDNYKKQLEEAQLIVDTLNEIVAEMENEDGSRNDEDMSRRA